MQYGASTSESQRQLEKLTTAVVRLLSHESRLVRIEAARVAASIPTDFRDRYAGPDQRKAFQVALEEYKQRLQADNDRAGSHMMMGGLYEMLGNQEKAMESYRTAIGVEPNVAGLRPNLAALLENRAGQIRREMGSASGITAGQAKELAQQAQQLIDQATALRMEEHELLKKDIRRTEGLPNTHGLEYRFAMSCYLQGEFEQTEKHLLIALGQQPENTTYLLALATFFQQQKRPDQAIKYANRLVQIDALHRGFRRLADDILAELRSNENKAP
jgi:tetratricopeptide (TPR) repeat protein